MPEQPADKSWLLHTGLIAAGGLIGAVALAGAVLAILTAIAANFLIWLLIIPWLVGDWKIWTVTVLLFLALGVGIAYVAFLVARALWRFFRRRVMERNDGVQV
jgi:membrane protein implicated in regulation of membrane protease activity